VCVGEFGYNPGSSMTDVIKTNRWRPLAGLKVLELGQLIAGAVRDGFLGVVWSEVIRWSRRGQRDPL